MNCDICLLHQNRRAERRRQWHPTPVLLPRKSHGRRSLVGCSPWGRKESDATERLHFHFSLSCIGEGNGNPLQCSCLENPRDGGAWWAAIYGVAQSQTRLKRLSSSSSSRRAENKNRREEGCKKTHSHSNQQTMGFLSAKDSIQDPAKFCMAFLNVQYFIFLLTPSLYLPSIPVLSLFYLYMDRLLPVSTFLRTSHQVPSSCLDCQTLSFKPQADPSTGPQSPCSEKL